MSTINTTLAEALSTVERPGDFYATGKLEFLAPRLEVEGVGPVALPLLPIQAEQLVTVAEQAPYGKGEDTLVDTAVRRTWQIDAGRVRIEGKHWQSTLDSIVARVADGLGVTAPVVADLYKLLVYDAGSFFVSHRDTEKSAGMFATLVIVLPSLYTGGELLIRHRGEEARLDLAVSEPSELAYAAFYADCLHEVLPVTSGCRLTLIYNVRRADGGATPAPPDYGVEQSRVAGLLKHWAKSLEAVESDAPDKLIYLLEHAYTPAELSFAALKGADAAMAEVLRVAAEQAACELYLALVSIEESGYAEHTGYYGRRRKRYYNDDEDNEEFEIGEVTDRLLRLTDWRKPNGERPELAAIPFDERELCPPEAFEGLQPDELHFHEATGNEGASFERTYRKAGLILWPRARTLAVFNQVGLSLTLPYLSQLLEAWEAEGDEDTNSASWRTAHELAGHMLRTWPREDWRYQRSESPETAEMLDILVRLGDVERLDAFIAECSAQGVYGRNNNPALTRALALLPAGRAADLLEQIIAHNAGKHLGASADLLALVSETLAQTLDLAPAGAALLQALPGAPAANVPAWQRPAPVDFSCLADVFTALCHIDPALAGRAVEQMLAHPETYDLDRSLVPAVLKLIDTPEIYASSAVQSLRAVCVEHLQARIAELLEAPRDWTRASILACRCQDCGELSQFLADPERKEWLFKAAEGRRAHVTDSIQRANADLTLRTDTRGRPYGLVCTKNQASYARRVNQRQQDLNYLERLGAA